MPRAAKPRRTAVTARNDGIYTGRTFTALEVVSMEPPAGVIWPGPVQVDELSPIVGKWVVAGGAGRKYVLLPIGIWAGEYTAADRPLPCRCKLGDQRARCRDLDNHELIALRGWRSCECWGRPVHDATPAGCCSRHERSARLAAWRPGDPPLDATPPADGDDVNQGDAAADLGTAYLRRETETGELVEAHETFSRLDELALEAELDEEAAEEGWRVVITAAKARIADCKCRCTLPWPKGVKSSGYHCPECHRNFSSYGLSTMHSKTFFDPCKDPRAIRDFRTGHELLEQRGSVWCQAELRAPGRPGFKYE